MSRWALGFFLLTLMVTTACDRREPEQEAAVPSPAPATPVRAEASPEVEATSASGAEARRPDVLLVIVDTLRADHLPAYGFAWGKTPTLDRLTRESVVFDRAIAASASTLPSHASLFTSRFVRQHSVGYSNGGTVLGTERTLAQDFHDAGYATAAFVSNIMLNQTSGLGRGFEVYDDRLPQQERNRPMFFERNAPLTTKSAISWLRGKSGGRPVFLLVHYQDPHGPYTPPDRVRAAIKAPPADNDEPHLSVNDTQSGYGGLPAYQALDGLDRPRQYEARYVAEILFMDRWLGLLLAAFDEHRPDAGHVVLFTADHGESMGEEGHWFEHGHTSMPNLARIPLVLDAPGIEPGRRSDPVSQVDVLPTLLEIAGLPVPDDASGIALGPYLRDGRPLPPRSLFMDLGTETGVYDAGGMTRIRFPSLEAGATGDTSAAEVTRYVWTDDGRLQSSGDTPVLDETTTAYLEHPVPLNEIDEKPDPDRVERLRALGYLEPEAPTAPADASPGDGSESRTRTSP